MRVLTIMAAMLLAGSASAADLCRGTDGKWSLGGLAFDATPEAVKAFAKPGPNGGWCKMSADGKLKSLAETENGGPYLYTDDVTYHINPIEP